MDITQVTWESLGQLAGLGAVVAVLMVLFFKPIISLVFSYLWEKKNGAGVPYTERADKLRSVVTNLATLGVSCGLSFWREGAMSGPVFLLALQGMAASITEYETVKNLLGLVGTDVSSVLVRSP